MSKTEKILSLLAKGKTVAQVADTVGVSKAYIYTLRGKQTKGKAKVAVKAKAPAKVKAKAAKKGVTRVKRHDTVRAEITVSAESLTGLRQHFQMLINLIDQILAEREQKAEAEQLPAPPAEVQLELPLAAPVVDPVYPPLVHGEPPAPEPTPADIEADAA